jgi:hypothetical protein
VSAATSGTGPAASSEVTLEPPARRCPADLVEGKVMSTIAAAALPDAVIDEARSELRHRLDSPGAAAAGRQRSMLQTRLEQLRKQLGGGQNRDREYQAERDAVQAALAQLPDEDRIRAFDAYRARLPALLAAIAVASLARQEELCRIVVEAVVLNDRKVEEIVWTPPARPFPQERRECPKGV